MVHPRGDEESGLSNNLFHFHRPRYGNSDTFEGDASVPLSPIAKGNISMGHRFDQDQRDSTTTEHRTGGWGNDNIDLNHPQRWLWSRYGRHLLKRKPLARGKRRGGKREKGFALDFEEIQRVNLLRLRMKLVGHVSRWESSNGEDFFPEGVADKREKKLNSWDEDFHNYVQALRDYDYIRNNIPKKWPSTRRITQIASNDNGEDNDIDNDILNSAFHDLDATRLQEMEESNPSPSTTATTANLNPLLNPITGKHAWRDRLDSTALRIILRQFCLRAFIAACAGFFLIQPMWIMVKDTHVDPLMVTTVAVIIVGATMACVLDEPIHILTSTAAYAAVLVVFLGLRLQADNPYWAPREVTVG